MEYVKRPIRAATGPSAQRLYVTTFLVAALSLALLCVAAVAYPVFYFNYVPKKVVSVPVHLQYNVGLNPYGLASVAPDLMIETAYDVTVELSLPRSLPNLNRGNFMLALFATRRTPPNPAQSFVLPPDDLYAHLDADNVVFTARRPVLMPYTDPLVAWAKRVAWLPWHVFTHQGETEVLKVPMGELVEWRQHAPMGLLLDVQGGQDLQVYSAKIELVARLRGVRWFMYHHRILSFLVGTGAFWSAEMVSMGLAWALIGYIFGAGEAEKVPKGRLQDMPGEVGGGDDQLVKRETGHVVVKEEDDGTGAPRFTGTRRPDIKYEDEDDDDKDQKIKKEESVAIDRPRRGSEAGEEDIVGKGKGTATSYDKDRGAIRRRSSEREGISS